MSVSTIGTQSNLSEEELADAIKKELGEWFGSSQVAAWKLLRSYRIPFAQPNQVLVRWVAAQTVDVIILLWRVHLGSELALQ